MAIENKVLFAKMGCEKSIDFLLNYIKNELNDKKCFVKIDYNGEFYKVYEFLKSIQHENKNIDDFLKTKCSVGKANNKFEYDTIGNYFSFLLEKVRKDKKYPIIVKITDDD